MISRGIPSRSHGERAPRLVSSMKASRLRRTRPWLTAPWIPLSRFEAAVPCYAAAARQEGSRWSNGFWSR